MHTIGGDGGGGVALEVWQEPTLHRAVAARRDNGGGISDGGRGGAGSGGGERCGGSVAECDRGRAR